MKQYELTYDVTIYNLRDLEMYEWNLAESTMTLLKLMDLNNLQLTDLRIVVHIGCR